MSRGVNAAAQTRDSRVTVPPTSTRDSAPSGSVDVTRGDTSEAFKCRWCDFTCSTATGRGLHEKRGHPSQFNNALGGPQTSKSTRVSDEEIRLIARAEATLLPRVQSGSAGRGICQLLEEYFATMPLGRKAASYQYIRRSDKYKTALREAVLALEAQNESMRSDSSNECEGGLSGSAEMLDGTEESVQELKDYIGEFDQLTDPDVFRQDWLDRICKKAILGENTTLELGEYLETIFPNTPGVRLGSTPGHPGVRDGSGPKGVPRRKNGGAELNGRAMPMSARDLLGKDRIGADKGVGGRGNFATKEQVMKKRRHYFENPRFCYKSKPSSRPSAHSGTPDPCSKLPQGPNRAHRRRQAYRLTQRLFMKDPSRLAKCIFNDEELEPRPYSMPEVVDGWAKSFEEKSTGIDVSIMKQFPAFHSRVWSPMECEVIEVFQKKMKGARGPDNVPVELLKSIPCCVLARIFNLILLNRDLPLCLKRSRTVLIPKVKDPKIQSDFRPISVSSVLVRLFHRILAKRIASACHMDPRQRGFIEADGCAENTAILEAMIKTARRKIKSTFLASLDIKNAFGSVAHEAILMALVKGGAPAVLIDYVKNVYHNFVTSVQLGKDKKSAQIRKGVLQGCGLSPILFNLVINQVLEKLPTEVGVVVGTEENNTKVSALGFADDLITAAGTVQGISTQLRALDETCPKFGLIFNPKKCVYLALKALGKRKTIHVQTDLNLSLSGETLKGLESEKELKYLGVLYTAEGIAEARVELQPLLARLKRAKLKPQQKLEMLRTYLLPKYIHKLVTANASIALFNGLDKMVRKFLTGEQGVLKLPQSAPMAFYYAPISEGGLGLLSYRVSIPSMMSLRLQRLKTSSSSAARAAFETEIIQEKLQRVGKAIIMIPKKDRLEPVYGAPQIRKYHARRLHDGVDGGPLKYASAARDTHAWLRSKSHMLTGRNFIHAVKLRINALPVLSRLRRGTDATRLCRAGCREQIESLDHVLGTCKVSRDMITYRHNKVVKRIASFTKQKGFTVLTEPRIKLTAKSNTEEFSRSGEYVQPDLILCGKDNVATVLDVCICGTYRPPNREHTEKIRKYNLPDVKDFVRVKFPEARRFRASAVVLSNRGILSSLSLKILKTLGLNKGAIQTLVVAAIEGSIAVFQNWTRRTGLHWRLRQRPR